MPIRFACVCCVVLAVTVVACRRDPTALDGRPCDLGQPNYPCVSGYVCNQDNICARFVLPNCDTDQSCPSKAEGLPCPSQGALLPCTDLATTCADGCRVCGSDNGTGNVWSACRKDVCVVGTMTACSRCADDCTTAGRILHATAACVPQAGTTQFGCAYSACDDGYVDRDQDLSNGCESPRDPPQDPSGTLASDVVGECTPGTFTALEACPASLSSTGCGTCVRECQPDGTWPATCTTPCSDVGECQGSPAATETLACGYCGTQTRTCSAGCAWGAFGACSDQQGLQYYPLAEPCRASELAVGAAPTPLNMGAACALPTTARAVAVNVAVVSTTHAEGRIAASCSSTMPAAAILDFPDDTKRASNAVLALSQDGAAYFASSSACTLAIDVVGYFGPPSALGNSYYALSPVFSHEGDLTSTAFLFGQAQDTGGVPASGVAALVFNATVLNAFNRVSFAGEIKVSSAASTNLPLTSLLYFAVDEVVANGGIVSLLASESRPELDFKVYVSNETGGGSARELHLNTLGYFAREGTSASPLRYYVVPPCRRLELDPARDASVDTATRLTLRGYSGDGTACANSTIPANAKAVALYVAIEHAGNNGGRVTLIPTGAGSDTSTLSFTDGSGVVGNGALVTLGDQAVEEVTFLTSSPSEVKRLMIDVYGYFR